MGLSAGRDPNTQGLGHSKSSPLPGVIVGRKVVQDCWAWPGSFRHLASISAGTVAFLVLIICCQQRSHIAVSDGAQI